MVGSVLATFIGKLIYGIRSELMTTKPLLGCASAFWVELLAAFIIMFLAASITHQAESVRKLIFLPFNFNILIELLFV